MKKILILICVVCLISSCASTDKADSGDEGTDDKPTRKSESSLYKDVDNALKVNCFLNPIACILSVPFRVIDAVEFIGDAVGSKDKASEKTEEPKAEAEELKTKAEDKHRDASRIP
jgi:uncharacterized protein YceK